MPRHLKSFIDDRVFSVPPICDELVCWDCRMYMADPEKILSFRKPTVLTTKNAAPQPDTTIGELPLEYLIKFNDVSYLWIRWVTGDWLDSVCRLRPVYKHYPHEENVELSDFEEYQTIDRVLYGMRSVLRSSDLALCRALIKWRGLPYDQATWEVFSERDGPFYAVLEKAVDAWRQTDHLIDSKAARTKRRMNLNVGKFKEFTEQPAFIEGGKLLQHQLDGLKWVFRKG